MSPDLMERFVGIASCGRCTWSERREAGTEEAAFRLATDSLIQHQAEDGCPNEGSVVRCNKAEMLH